MDRRAMGLLDRVDLKSRTTAPPDSIETNERNEFLIAWPGTLVVVPALRMRDACACAECIEEGTGRKLLVTEKIPEDIRAVDVWAVGSYAIQIRWSDGHDSGIYSWDLLRRICGLEGAPAGG
jgi:DUF971 family protein